MIFTFPSVACSLACGSLCVTAYRNWQRRLFATAVYDVLLAVLLELVALGVGQ